ncbi:MAG: hypothetical protein KAT68_10825 [Bacteroidales bacterium]|nr:hypothetical protein [Bacteroidales bacterium]
MKLHNTIYLFGLIVFLSLTQSCTKEEGEGGTSSITGKVYVINYNSEFTEINSEYYAQEEDVYIIYGDDDVYSERFKTHYDGTYRFQYLRQGNYKIFAYSKDSTENSESGYIPVVINVEITDNYQEIKVQDIIILK